MQLTGVARVELLPVLELVRDEAVGAHDDVRVVHVNAVAKGRVVARGSEITKVPPGVRDVVVLVQIHATVTAACKRK